LEWNIFTVVKIKEAVRYFLECAFKGTAYSGWQRQPHALAVQEVIEDALSKLLGEELSVTGAGRTDTGVHAHQMYAHFETDKAVDQEELEHRLNRFLPEDIAVKGIWPVHEQAHARFDATSRSYRYWVIQTKDPFYSEWAYAVHRPLDLNAMNHAAQLLIGRKDFECFSKSKTDVKTYICDLRKAEWRKEEELLTFEIEADRFLRNMVRAVVGTLLEVGLGKRSIESVDAVLASKDRSEAGVSVPAKGLSLVAIQYPYSDRLT
jgi:tRNA pseudouridine38-40 synthase